MRQFINSAISLRIEEERGYFNKNAIQESDKLTLNKLEKEWLKYSFRLI